MQKLIMMMVAVFASAMPIMAETEIVDGIKWSYTVSDGKVELHNLAIPKDTIGAIAIPPTLGSYPVTSIGSHAFCDCSGLTSVTIPSSVKVIGEEAFDGCTALTSVNLSEGLEVIGEDAFCGCENLGDVSIPSTVKEMDPGCFAFAYKMNSLFVAEGNSHFKSIDGVVYSKDGSRLVWFPAGRTGDWTVPEHVTEIVEFAIAGGSLSALSIGAGVERIGDGIVVDNFKLALITVDAENPYFKDEDGILFSKDGTRLLAYPAAKKDVSVYTVPATVTSVDQDAFGGSSLTGIILPSTLKGLWYETFVDSVGLESVIVGAGLEIVGDNAFYSIPRLRTVTLPASVKTIERLAFEDCGNSGTTIYVPETAVADKNAYEDCPATIVKYASAALVKFDLNYEGAPSYPYDRNVVSGQPVGILMKPSRAQYAFAGWYTLPDGGTEITDATVVTGNVTYYAHWTEGSSPVTPGYDVIDEKDITAPYAAAKAVTLKGAANDGGNVMGIVELKLGKVSRQKTSKVSGSFIGLDGKKRTMKAVAVTGIYGSAPATVTLDVKGLGTMKVVIGGSQFAGTLGGWHVQSAAVGGNWTKGVATAKVAVGDVSAFGGGVLAELLPTNEVATVARGKWAFKKAATVKYVKAKSNQPTYTLPDATGKAIVIDTSKGKTNLSGLKLTYTPKSGNFKGSFKVFALQAGKLKKFTMNVNGVVVDGVGHGKATCKKPSVTWAVSVQ